MFQVRPESERLEYKREFTGKGCAKTVCAFANTDGGDLYIGVEDDGTVRGVADPDADQRALVSTVRDSIVPDATGLLSLSTIDVGGLEVVQACVAKGDRAPYSVTDDPRRFGCAYVRRGPASVPASPWAVGELAKAPGAPWEERRSVRQDLSFGCLEDELGAAGVGMGELKGMRLGDGSWTNLALALSDQCPTTVLCASFRDDRKVQLEDRETVSGSVVAQLRSAWRFLDEHNPMGSELQGMTVRPVKDWDPFVLREGVANAVAHRDYSQRGPVQISRFPSFVEVISTGRLPDGISAAEALAGRSLPRNPGLVEALGALGLVESLGSGLMRMSALYDGCPAPMSFEPMEHSVVLRLPPQRNAKEPAADARGAILSLARNGQFVRRQVDELLGVSAGRSVQILSEMVSSGDLVKVGNGRNTAYRLSS